MPITHLRPSFTFTEDRLAQLREVVPEAFADGKVNWEALREALGEHLEDESEPAEHFGLSWPGKREARRAAAAPALATLVPCPGEGVNEATTRNIFIEGDNLEVLKLLQKSYAGRVKMIYIDPPYNTGNDFIYVDDYAEPVESYLRRTGQMGEGGELLTTNPRTGGRFHSNWLNMMYPRLVLARQVLNENGMIFISIDDTECSNLRIVMDELFGAENFIAMIAWEKRYTRSNNARLFYSLKDNILVYRRGDLVSQLREPRTDKANSIYGNPDNDPRGPWTSSSYVNPATKEQRPNLVYDILNPSTNKSVEHPTNAWKYSYEEHLRHIREKRLWWGKDGKAKYPRKKVFLSEGDDGLVPIDLWDHESSGTTDEGGLQIKSLFGEAVFDNPKPTRLISRMMRLCTSSDEDAIVLDFFAGSCSAAHAVMELNHLDGGDRRFVVIQLPEPILPDTLAHRAGFNSISDIGKERIRRVISQTTAGGGGGQPSLNPTHPPLDLGFKVLKLTRSHFRRWRDYEGDSIAEIQSRFDEFESPLVDGWTPEDLLVEVMLQEGFPLDSTVSRWDGASTNQVQIVASDACLHRLWVCLDTRVAEETVAALALAAEDVFVCLDSAVTDEQKMRLADRFNVKVI